MIQKKEWTSVIEIEMNKERNLKNLKQIGTPKEENKIYVEHMVYAKIKENSYKEKRVFVLMGHTERMESRYVTFVEGVIPVREITFQGNIPRWNNSTWSEVFREIKRLYEDMIIVGWAIDIKGMLPKVTPELERVHREHFGGVHQILFLLDTIEQEETFYIHKDYKLMPKDGFYIYQKARKKESMNLHTEKRELIPIKVMETEEDKLPSKYETVDVEVDIQQEEEIRRILRGGRYRELVNGSQQKPTKNKEEGTIGIAIAVAMLIFVIGVGIYEDRDNLFGTSNSIPTTILQEQKEEDVKTDVELQEESVETEHQDTEANVIPMDVISGSEKEE